MAFSILGTPKPAFFDSNGSPLASGTLSVLEPSDDSNKTYYPTADDADAATNGAIGDITLDSRGETPTALFGVSGEDYKLVLKDSTGTTLWTVDDIYLGNTSNRVVYNQGGTGAVDTTVEAKLREVVTPEDYGAVGDGVADDTAELQAAITANSVVIGVRGSTYKISSTITIPANRIIDLTDCDVTFTGTIYAFTASGSNLTFTGGTITGPSGSYTASQGGIYVSGTVNGATVAPTFLDAIKIRNVSVDLVGAEAIRIEYCTNAEVDGCKLTNCGYFGISYISVVGGSIRNNIVDTVAGETGSGELNAYGISVSNVTDADTVRYPRSEDVEVTGNIVRNIPTWHGLTCKGGSNVRFINNSTHDCRRGVVLSYTNFPAIDCCISHNVCKNTLARTNTAATPDANQQSEAFWDVGSASLKNTNNRIEHNTAYQHGAGIGRSAAIFIEYAENGVCAHNTLLEPWLAGVIVSTGVDNYVIDSNTVIDAKSEGTGATPAMSSNVTRGIDFASTDMDNLTVTNNTIVKRDATVSTYVGDFGMLINNTALKSIFFDGNNYSRLGTGKFSIGGDVTGLTGEIEYEFTGTLTGYATPPTGSVKSSVNGNLVTMHFPQISGTSNATGLTMTGLPAWTTPESDRVCIMTGLENSGAVLIVATINSGSATITFGHSTANNTTFTASGGKGIYATTITYLLKDN